MASEPSRKIGSIDCMCCGESIPVRQNGRTTLNLSCPWCGLSAYAKEGSEAHGVVTGWLRKGEPPVIPIEPVASVATGAASKGDAPAASVGKLLKVVKSFDLGAL